MSSIQYECIELNLKTPTDYFGRFIFKPFPAGQGITIGNALRRVLLKNLTGLSIVNVQIAGINHEFSTIDGVREDVIDILLNLKEIVFKGNADIKPFGRLKVQGPAIVTAQSLELDENIEILNPTQYIATIFNNSILEIEITLEWGKGYELAENKAKAIETDALALDSIFMPVRRVVYHVENLFSDSNNQQQEQLIMDIWTNGTICPTEALSLGASELINWLTPIQNLAQPLQINPKTEEQVESKIEMDFDTIRIEELNLSARAFNSLKRDNIHYIGQLLNYSMDDLKKIKNFGQKSIDEVIYALKQQYGLLIE
jgi:DNA-directed RNA polymerase subunit alpha